jgi:hemerythrin
MKTDGATTGKAGGAKADVWLAGLDAAAREHEEQEALLASVEDAVRRGAGAGEVGRVLDDFVEHANAHFLSEQLLMRNHAYEAYEQHVHEHDELMTRARRLLVDVWGGRLDAAQETVAALRNWLLVHMKTTDAALEEYLARRAEESRAAEVGR